MNRRPSHLPDKEDVIIPLAKAAPEIPPEVRAEIISLREQIAFHARKGRVTFHTERLNQILKLYDLED